MKSLIALSLAFAFGAVGAWASENPKGLMMTMDFESVSDGLIPSKGLFPLYTPMDELELEWFNGRHMLAFQEGQGLDIPHSSLLDPNGDEWILTIRAFCLTDGMILSQANDTHGFAIYMKDGHIEALVKTGNSAFTLLESAGRGRTKVLERWTTIELRVRDGMAILYLNRERVAMMMDQPALTGPNMRVRLGQHRASPALMASDASPFETGFTGAINSFKIIRQ